MKFTAYVEGQAFPIEVPESLAQEAVDFFVKMDQDMDHGYQMSREWVDQPSLENRCQIAADKILSALHTENQQMAMLMVAYIQTKMPDVTGAILASGGDMLEHELITNSNQ